jgi:hypothetical protein
MSLSAPRYFPARQGNSENCTEKLGDAARSAIRASKRKLIRSANHAMG